MQIEWNGTDCLPAALLADGSNRTLHDKRLVSIAHGDLRDTIRENEA